MERIIARLNEEAARAFEKAGLDTSFAKITVSNRPDLCEYQCNGAMACVPRPIIKAPIHDRTCRCCTCLQESPAICVM